MLTGLWKCEVLLTVMLRLKSFQGGRWWQMARERALRSCYPRLGVAGTMVDEFVLRFVEIFLSLKSAEVFSISIPPGSLRAKKSETVWYGWVILLCQ
ncbi:hypothetical protein PoB_000121900 [Plakobranchus ocellatus]|uniref:Secreted protein n=1 Tax=Plakobranchus ocellatus TaxID=259542 RepID=A0AAV3XV28_9GAST|nr:hypothetical protein PoB_000121900 [Plakobranchus ocellatus]